MGPYTYMHNSAPSISKGVVAWDEGLLGVDAKIKIYDIKNSASKGTLSTANFDYLLPTIYNNSVLYLTNYPSGSIQYNISKFDITSGQSAQLTSYPTPLPSGTPGSDLSCEWAGPYIGQGGIVWPDTRVMATYREDIYYVPIKETPTLDVSATGNFIEGVEGIIYLTASNDYPETNYNYTHVNCQSAYNYPACSR